MRNLFASWDLFVASFMLADAAKKQPVRSDVGVSD